jgi:hypothetical protein
MKKLIRLLLINNNQEDIRRIIHRILITIIVIVIVIVIGIVVNLHLLSTSVVA